METANDLVRRYIQDAIAAEKNFETQLRGFANEGDNAQVQTLFKSHADETKTQYQRLTQRLEALGGEPSTMKSIMAHLFGMAPKAASIGHDESERVTHNLMIAYSVENSEVAMYESLATIAAAAGDVETERLARDIQQQERQTAEKVWTFISACARASFDKLTGGKVRGAA